MSINNYVVKGKPVKFEEKGTVNFYNYLNNKEHKNHKGKTEKIYNIFSNDNFVDVATGEVRKRNLEIVKKGVGGRPLRNHSHSFVFSPRTDVKPSKKQWEKISKLILNDLVGILPITAQELKKQLFINIHEQKNSHLNMLLGKVIGGKSIDWGNKKVSKLLKLSFTTHFDEVMGVSVKDYKPKKQKERRTPQNIYAYKELQERLSEIDIEEAKVKKYIKNISYYVIRIIEKKSVEKNKRLLNKKLDQIPLPEKKQVLEIVDNYLDL